MSETFTDWLLDQADRDDPIGDVARDASKDKSFPKGSPDDVRGYLRHRSSAACREALEDAIEEYQL